MCVCLAEGSPDMEVPHPLPPPSTQKTHPYIRTYVHTNTRHCVWAVSGVCMSAALVSTMPTRWTTHPGKILHDPCVALRLPSHTGEAHLEFHQHIKFKVKLTMYDNNVKVEGVVVPCVYTIIAMVLYV